jgi:hypothetical protein
VTFLQKEKAGNDVIYQSLPANSSGAKLLNCRNKRGIKADIYGWLSLMYQSCPCSTLTEWFVQRCRFVN